MNLGVAVNPPAYPLPVTSSAKPQTTGSEVA